MALRSTNEEKVIRSFPSMNLHFSLSSYTTNLSFYHSKDGMTALMWSAQQNHHHIVDLLLKHGANLQAHCSDGSSVLHQAAYAGSTKAVQSLITHGADKHLPLKRFLDATNQDGSTPLLLACYAGHLEVVTCLLQHGASVHTTNQAGWTPLHGAASGGHLSVAKVLLDHGANTQAKVRHHVNVNISHTPSEHILSTPFTTRCKYFM